MVGVVVKLDPKTPNEVLDYLVNLTPELTAESDTIQSVTWTIDPSFSQVTTSNTATTATIWVTGGTVGQFPEITAKITTVGARKYERTAIIPIVAVRS